MCGSDRFTVILSRLTCWFCSLTRFLAAVVTLLAMANALLPMPNAYGFAFLSDQRMVNPDFGKDWTEVHTSPGPLDERDPDAAACSWGLRSTYAQYHVQHGTGIHSPYGRPASTRQRGHYLEQSKPGGCKQHCCESRWLSRRNPCEGVGRARL